MLRPGNSREYVLRDKDARREDTGIAVRQRDSDLVPRGAQRSDQRRAYERIADTVQPNDQDPSDDGSRRGPIACQCRTQFVDVHAVEQTVARKSRNRPGDSRA